MIPIPIALRNAGNAIKASKAEDTSMNVSLRRIDESNRKACIALSVASGQEKLIAPNRRSLEQANSNPRFIPLGIYADKELVGFAMYEARGNSVFSVHRLMIDAQHQRKGIGLRAMQLVMEQIWSAGGKTIYLSFRPENLAAKQMYEKLAFEFYEEESDGELIYRFGEARDLAT